jgi:GNAT superfamily N-acetyltransferase
VTIRRAVPADAPALAVVAAATFPLACPPHTTDEAKAAFIRTVLSEQRFGEYLADPTRVLLVDDDGVGHLRGYTMLVFGEPTDTDAAAAITIRPTVELSKCYVLPSQQGYGTSGTLMAASLDVATEWGAQGIWLGVNEENARAIRFYEKSGFAKVGRKSFRVGDRDESDFVLERSLTVRASV